MPTARYAIFPLLASGRIYVASGSTHSGYGTSTVFEYYQPAALGDFSTTFQFTSSGPRFRFPTATSKNYNVQTRPNFSTAWTTLTTLSGTGDYVDVAEPVAGADTVLSRWANAVSSITARRRGNVKFLGS